MPSRRKASVKDTRAALSRSLETLRVATTAGTPNQAARQQKLRALKRSSSKIVERVLRQRNQQHGETVVPPVAVKIPQNADAAIEMVLVAHLKQCLPEEDGGGGELNEQRENNKKNEKKNIASCSKASQPRPEKLAFEKCYMDKGLLHGMAFEALVASHAVWSESCWKCKTAGSLEWCGGPDDSWRDLYCRNCQSCFEIKSNEDYHKIDKAVSTTTLA